MKRNVGRIGRLILLAIVSLVLASCGTDASEQGGNSRDVRIAFETTDYSPVVMVILPGGSSLCTGTFVSEKAVLTAAHCVLESGRYIVKTDWGSFSTYSRVYTGRGDVDSPDDIALLLFDEAIASRELDRVYDIDHEVSRGDTLRLVGYGCNNLFTRRNAGVKRTGTNQVSSITDYIEFVTPLSLVNETRRAYQSRNILGPADKAASCFGDSGGPALRSVDGSYKVTAVTHAGGRSSTEILSEYVNVATHASNRSWLRSMNSTHNLGIRGL